MDAKFSVLSFARPGGTLIPIGVLLLDRSEDQLRVLLRTKWDDIADADDVEILASLSSDLMQVSREIGGRRLLEYLDDTLSNTIRITDGEFHGSNDLDITLHDLFRRYVEGEQNSD